jgi:hypothetical protein
MKFLVFFLLRKGLEWNSELLLSSTEWLETKLQSSECFFFLLPNGSDRNSKLFLSSTEWLRTEFRAFSVPRETDGILTECIKIRVPFDNCFLLIKWQPCSEPMSWWVTLSNIYLFFCRRDEGAEDVGFGHKWNARTSGSLGLSSLSPHFHPHSFLLQVEIIF